MPRMPIGGGSDMNSHQRDIEALAIRIAGRDPDLDERTHLKSDLNLTSFDMMLLIALVEHASGGEVSIEELSRDMTVGGLIRALR